MSGNLTISNTAGKVLQTPRPGTTIVQQTTPASATATVDGAKPVAPGSGTPIVVEWSSILNKPAFGTASLRDVPAVGNAAPAQVVLGTDTRLSDARTPVYHTHVLADITDMTVFSRQLAMSVDADAAKTLLGIPSFTSPLAIAQGGTGATNLAAAQSNLVIPTAANPLALAAGGTGSGVLATAQANLGIPNNTNPLAITSGGSGSNTLSGAQTNLGIPTTAAPLPVNKGGTAASTLAGAQTSLGIPNGTSPLAITSGGTGSGVLATVQTNLGIPTTTNPLAVAAGGTGSTTDTAARAALFVPYQISLTSAVRVSAGTTAQRNASPQAGDFRFNTDLGRAEIYNGTIWADVAAGSGAPLRNDYFEYTSTSACTLKRDVVNGGSFLSINGKNETIPSAGVTFAATGLAISTVYYAYAYMNAGVMMGEFSTTVPTEDATSGVKIKTGDATRTCVGMVNCTTAAQFDSKYVISFANRRMKKASGAFSATRNWSTTTPTELDAGGRSQFLHWGDEVVAAYVGGGFYNNTAGSWAIAATALNTSVTVTGQGSGVVVPVAGYTMNPAYSDSFSPVRGFNYMTVLCSIANGGTGSFTLSTSVLYRG